MSPLLYEYYGDIFPAYLKTGNACQHIATTAKHFCTGKGLDVGAGRWPLPGSIPVDVVDGGDAMDLPEGSFQHIFSSHCLEHLPNPVAALEHWKTRLMPGGVLFLYLPHKSMSYWNPVRCRKHLHAWAPEEMAELVTELGFVNVIHSQRDLAWSFSCLGFAPK